MKNSWKAGRRHTYFLQNYQDKTVAHSRKRGRGRKEGEGERED
jgi:hypothetical protein